MTMIRNGLRTRSKTAKPTPAGSIDTAIDADLVRTLAQLIAESDLAEMEVEKGDLRIKLVRHTATAAAPVAAAHHAPVVVGTAPVQATEFAAEPTAESAADHPGVVKSPMVGTVYRRANPDSKAFVDLGAAVKAGDKIFLVEAMKTFNEIVAPRSGTVSAILVEDGQPVEYGQPLLVIE